mgnify:CR=1 FL=1
MLSSIVASDYACPARTPAEQLALFRQTAREDRSTFTHVLPRPDGARLLYRGEWRADGEPWRLEAELALSEVERKSLMAAAGDAEQPLAGALLAQLGSHEVVGLTLAPQGAVSVARLTASLGQPRLRLQLVEGEAWVYPRLGLTAHSEDERLRLLQVVPRRVLSVR